MKYVVAYASGFNPDSFYRDEREYGETIAEIVESIHGLPERFKTDGVVFINGEEIPRKNWHLVRPQPSADVPVSVTLHLAMQGGGGGDSGGSKGIVGMLGQGAAFLFGGPLGSTLMSTIGSLAISVLGSLAMRALSKPPEKPKKESTKRKESSLDGNVLEPGASIPRVIGTHKVFPPFIANPLVSMDGEDEYVEAVLALTGPHQLNTIKAGEVDVLNAQDIQVETRQGWPTDTAVTLVTRQSFTDTSQIQLSSHEIMTDEFVELADQTNPLNSLPVWHTFTTRQSPDELWISMNLPNGLYDGNDTTVYIAVPFRIRFRQVGSATWINCPEIWLANRKTSPIKKEFKFYWKAGWSHVIPPRRLGFVRAYRLTRTQTTLPSSAGNADTPAGYWVANNYFSTTASVIYSSTASFLKFNNTATTHVQNVRLYQDRTEFWLDPAIFPKGQYEIQIKRGYAGKGGADDNYELQGNVRDCFWYQDTATPQIQESTENRNSDAYVSRVASVWNEHPCPVPNNLALIAIKAKNRQLPAISTYASGYVQDWNGAAWSNWTTTSNPAPHYYDVLAGSLNLDPLPTALVDSASLVSWRTRCNTKGYNCNVVVDNQSTLDTLSVLASCGYARPYNSEIWGVIQDDDRSAQSPVQVFTPRNSSNFRYSKAFTRPLDALRVSYLDRNILYSEQQLIRYYAGVVPNPRMEQAEYTGLTTAAEVQKRADFDLAQSRLRSTTYMLDADAEAIVCRNGDLVAIQSDVLLSQTGYGRIKAKAVAAGNITTLTLYDTIDIGAGPNAVAIRLLDGTITTRAINEVSVETNTLTFTIPLADSINIDEDCLIVVGPSGSEFRRVIVTSIKPSSDFTCSMEFVDEANSLQALI